MPEGNGDSEVSGQQLNAPNQKSFICTHNSLAGNKSQGFTLEISGE